VAFIEEAFMRGQTVPLVASFLLASSMAGAQTGAPLTTTTSAPNLALLIPNLFGPSGLKVESQATLPDGSTHSAHFNSAFQAEFTQFNIALASQIASIPLPTPASGYTYVLDPSLGVFQRSTQSFGPIMSERAETIGKNKFSFGFSYQHFTFDTLEGVDLDNVQATFTHDDYQLGGGRSDVVTTRNSIDTRVGQYNSFFTYGITKRLDVSLAIPLVAVDMDVSSDAVIHRLGTASNPKVHYFTDSNGNLGTERIFRSSGAASGLGDVVVRLKATAPKSGPTTLALITDFRFPTGDEENLLGSGAWGVRPLMILSWGLGRVAPHVNLGYQWNGKSVLGGDVATGRKAELPDQFLYAAGVDIGVGKRATIALDMLGQRVVNSPRLIQETLTVNGQKFPQIAFANGSFNVDNASAGIKINVGGSVLLDLNVLLKLDDGGLRDKVTPLLGFEYSF
jgi:hypothetical protein